MSDDSKPIHEFDLIWLEGTIYNIGFERELNEWWKFLKQGGYIAVSKASWFTEKRPRSLRILAERLSRNGHNSQ